MGIATLALAALAIAAILPGTARATPTWLAPTDISAAPQEAFEPQVALDAAGDAVAVWWRYDGTYVVQAATRPAGGAWSAPVDLSAPGPNVPAPAVAIDPAGDAVAVWRWQGSGHELIQASTDVAGGAWSAPVDLSATSLDVSEPAVAIDPAGEAVAVWWRYDGSVDVVQAASEVVGGSWSAPTDLSSADFEARDPEVAVDPAGEAVAVWLQYDGTNDIAQAASRPAGGGWSAPTDLSAVGFEAYEPEVAINPAGDATAIWAREDGADLIAQAAARPAGGSWGPPTDLSAAGADALEPQVAIDPAGEAVAAWWRSSLTEQIVQATAKPAGGSWATPTELSVPGQEALRPRIAIDPVGDAVAIWENYEGAADHVVQASTRPAGGGWATPTDLSTLSHEYGRPEVAVDADGDAVAAWEHYDGTRYAIQAAGYDAAGPQLRRLSIPAAGTAGVPLSFSASPLDVWSALGATRWSFGDGGSATGTAVSHAFTAPGTYTVTVTGADALGNTSAATGTVSIGAPPAPLAPSPPKGKKGRARAARIVETNGGAALLRLRCAAAAGCAGTARLGVKVVGAARSSRHARKANAFTIGRASFALRAGADKAIRIPLTQKGAALVRAHGRKGLAASLTGSGVVGRAVLLKAGGHRHRR